MNKKGYAIHELVILCAVLAILFGVAITKITLDYQDASEQSTLKREEESTIKLATELYVQAKEDEFKKEEDNFLFGKDLSEAGYLIQTEDFNYSNTKIKVTYNETSQKYDVEIVS